MDVKLVVMGGKNAGKEIPVSGPKFFIGRAEDCQMRPQTDLVSRHHCVILLEEGFVAVRDFGSKNGTLVNGEAIRSEQELKSGDRLKIGPLEFEVRLSVEVGGKKKPKVHTVLEAAARTAESRKAADEEDITSWLDDGETATPASRGDAQRRPSPAKSGATSAAASAPPSAPKEKKEPEEKEPEKKPEVKITGKFSTAAKPTAESSMSAAADMLKNFYK